MVRSIVAAASLTLFAVPPAVHADTPSTKKPAEQTVSQDFDAGSLDPVTRQPLYYRRPLKRDELTSRSLRELNLMRNWIFARAGNTFRKRWLRDFFTGYAWYHPRQKQDLSILTDYDKQNAALIAEVEAGFSEGELIDRRLPLLNSLSRDPGYPSNPAHPTDVIELKLIARRLGVWLDPKPKQKTAEDVSPLEDPRRLDKLLTLKDLEDFSRRDLRILRNTIYARHGRPFKSNLLRDYFSSMNWYSEDPKYTDDRLSKVDRKNIKLVLSLEDELGGPMTDQEHFMEEYGGFMGGA